MELDGENCALIFLLRLILQKVQILLSLSIAVSKWAKSEKNYSKNAHVSTFDQNPRHVSVFGRHLAMLEESFDKGYQLIVANEESGAGSTTKKCCKALKTSLVIK